MQNMPQNQTQWMQAGCQTCTRYKNLYPCSTPKETDSAVVDKCIQQLLIVCLLCARSTVNTHHFSLFAFQSSRHCWKQRWTRCYPYWFGTHDPFTPRRNYPCARLAQHPDPQTNIPPSCLRSKLLHELSSAPFGNVFVLLVKNWPKDFNTEVHS